MTWLGGFLDFVSRLFYEVLVTVLAGTIVLLRNPLARMFEIAAHLIKPTVFGRPYVLIWNDDDVSHSEKLATLLSASHPNLDFKILKSPREIRTFSLAPKAVRAVILIDTDVTKLSEDPAVRASIEDALIKFVKKGGGLIGTHDIIYRRTRNTKLQQAFGCTAVEFQRYSHPIKYVKNRQSDKHPLTKDLPDSFQLGDEEILWGKWAKSVTCIFQTHSEIPHPLVVAHEFSRGRLVWLNSGDRHESLCSSVATPETEFVRLLANALDWFSASCP